MSPPPDPDAPLAAVLGALVGAPADAPGVRRLTRQIRRLAPVLYAGQGLSFVLDLRGPDLVISTYSPLPRIDITD